jgi:tetratricopeptide (TPR) repeat protein
MEAIHPQGAPLALEPLDDPSAGASAAGQDELRMTAADEFLAAATKEYQEGHVDQTLWARALAQSGDDQFLVIAAYLRARATALQLQKRDRRVARRARRAKLREDAKNRRQDTANPEAESEPHLEIPPAAAVEVLRRGMQLKPAHVAAAGAALASIVAAIWLIASPQRSESTAPQRASAAAPSTKGTSPAGLARGAQPVAGSPNGAADARDSPLTLDATVQQLKDAGNWNVLVLYASKWTRDEPDNATAWKELSIGYANLHQFDDAARAAARAAELSPGEALLWRNLGHLNVMLDRLPEAESAFDKALTVNADDSDALCGAALVAQGLGRTKEAEAIAKRVDPAYGRCPGLMDGESVAVVVRPVASAKPASKVRR